MADALPGQVGQGEIVVDINPAGVLGQNAAMAMVRVLAKALVRDEIRLRMSFPDGPQRLLHDALVRPGAGALCILAGGDAEEDEGANAQVHRAADLIDEPVDAE